MRHYPNLEVEIQNHRLSTFLERSKISSDFLQGEGAVLIDTEVATDLFTYPGRLDAFLVGFCVEGEANVMLNMREVKLEKNSFFTFAPKHVTQFFYTNHFRICALAVSSELFNSIHIDTKFLTPLSIESERAVMQLGEEDITALRRYFTHLEQELHTPQSPFKKDLIGTLIASTFYKVGEIATHYMASHRDMSSVRSRAEDYFKLFIHVLGQNFLNERNVGFYANQLNITPKYLTTLIKRVSGRSVSQWIDYYVTIEAKTMLKFTDKSILEISTALKFANQSFFGSYFRRNTGMSPSQYRSMIGG